MTEATEAVKTLGGAPAAALPVPQPDQPQGLRIQVTRATKYSDLTAQDMGYYAQMMMGIKGYNWTPSEQFMREMVDKGVREVNAGRLPVEAINSNIVDAQGFIKSNELSTVGQSGYGSELVADMWRNELWNKVRQDNVVAPLLPMLDMPNNPYELPYEGGDPTVYHAAETADIAQLVLSSGNAVTASKPGSGKIQMSAKKLSARVAWSAELNEDSAIPIISNYRKQTVRSLQNAIDNVILNGDTETAANTSVNLIDGTPTAGTKYLAFDGLRKYALVTNTAQAVDCAGAPTLTKLREARFKLSGAYALRPRDCAWIVDDSTYGALLNMPEFLTMDKAGASATNLTGQIGVIDGVPVFATAEMSLSNTAGKISTTGSNNVKGQAILVFRPNWLIGYRRQVQANVEFFSWADAYHMIVSVRLCLVKFDTTSAAELYDITV
jgi:HK97 family phage major capsid protein